MSLMEVAAKRALDIGVSAAGLIVLGPFLLAVAVAIRVDSRGPAFFLQDRLGRGGRIFRIIKFRSMVHDADVRLGAGGRVVNSEDDPRHTRIGRMLRRYSLDELPQLVNVLVGDMSLVGPRPDMPSALTLSPETTIRLSVRPGITGLAQVRGRNLLNASEKWILDAEYAVGASFAGDLRLLAKTLGRVTRANGIYRRDG